MSTDRDRVRLKVELAVIDAMRPAKSDKELDQFKNEAVEKILTLIMESHATQSVRSALERVKAKTQRRTSTSLTAIKVIDEELEKL